MKSFFVAIIILICLPFFAVGVYEAYKANTELQTFSQTVGKVTGNSYLTTTNDGVISGAYYPNVEFADQTDQKFNFTDGIGSLPADYEIGTAVNVVYDSKNPSKGRIYSWKRFWLAPSIFIAVGILPIFIFLLIMRKINL